MGAYLQVWVPSVAPKDFCIGGGRWRLDHVISKLTNSIQNLVKVPMDCLNGPPKGLVHHPKPLIVPHYMKEHCNLFLNRSTCIVLEQPLVLKRLHKEKKGILLILNIDTHSTSVEW